MNKDGNKKSSMGAITPGTVLEISGPPGIGKTAMVVSVAMSARLGERAGPGHRDQPHDDAEVLIIGAG
jgi:RecA/RadA recombinase